MWFFPAAPPDYLFICQDCKYTQRVSGPDIARVIWNFRACRSCQSTTLPATVPMARTSTCNGVQVAESAPTFLLRPTQGQYEPTDL